VETFPDQVFLRKGSSSIWIASGFDGGSELDWLVNPDILFSLPGCEIVKDQQKIKVARAHVKLGGQIRQIYVKRYNAFSWRYRLFSVFGRSAAFRAWIGAEILRRAGFKTGSPIAAVECRSWWMLTKSFYISEAIPSAKTVDIYWTAEVATLGGREGFARRRSFLNALADLFRHLHEEGIYHNDLKDVNILVSDGDGRQEYSFFLLDLEGVRRYPRLKLRRRTKNLVQLNRTMRTKLRRSDRLYWLKAYLGKNYLDRELSEKWLKRILDESRRSDVRSVRKTGRDLTN